MKFSFHHVHLICSDLEKTIGFFTGLLDATFTGKTKFGTADGATLDVHGCRVYLRAARPDEKIPAETCPVRFGYNHLCLEVADIDAAHQEITWKGGVFFAPPATEPAGTYRMAFLSGPDCITVELLQMLR